MRRLVVPLAILSILSFVGCKDGAASKAADEAKTRQLALEAEAKKAEAETAKKLAELEKAAQAKAAEKDGAELVADVPPGQNEVKEKDPIDVFAARLIEAGFGTIVPESLLPDLLGGLEECDAPLRTKLAFERGYATLGRFGSEEKAKTCLAAYLKTPGADKYAHLYVLKGEYMLELHPELESKARELVTEQFRITVSK